MKVPSPILTLFCTLFVVTAASFHDSRGLAARHARISHRSPTLVARAPDRKRCKPRPSSKNKTAPQSTNPPKPPKPSPKPNDFHSNPADSKGVINVPSNCGPIGATRKVTRDSGPNGSIHWLNCGLTGSGWNPPHVEIKDLIYVHLTTAIESPASPFKACRPFIHLFEKYGNELGIPGIILASFAMQESSCNPNTIGGGGEQGLMQITHDKCGGAPGGNCRDPDFNVRTGARFFADTLKNNGNNVILAAGSYNGWKRGLTFERATAAAKSQCCRCQNNCDYLHQFFNGWLQNVDAYNQANPLGVFFNLNVC